MRRSELLQGIREMKFVSVEKRYSGGEISQIAAAELLGISERTFRRWCERYRDEGPVGLTDRRRGNAAHNRAPNAATTRAPRSPRPSGAPSLTCRRQAATMPVAPRQRKHRMADPEIVKLRELIASRPRPADLAERRRAMDANAQSFPLDPEIEVQAVVAAGVPAEWTLSPGADQSRVVLYLHGGGYVFGSILSHRHLVAEIGRVAGCRTLALDYRLAPEHPFPAPVEDTLAAYRFLLERGVEPRHVTIAGDSAGGGLVVAAMVAIKQAGLAQPACGWAISPWVDMEATGESFTSLAQVDPTVSRETILDIAGTYLKGADPRSPLAAPIHADLRGIAPLLIQVGAAEVLLDDALRLAGRAGAADVPVRLEVWPEMIHVWHVFHRMLGAGRRAVAEGGAYIKAAMQG